MVHQRAAANRLRNTALSRGSKKMDVAVREEDLNYTKVCLNQWLSQKFCKGVHLLLKRILILFRKKSKTEFYLVHIIDYFKIPLDIEV